MKLLGKLLINTLALLITAYIVPGFVVANLTAAIVAAVVIGVINTFIKPVLQIISLPITILTLGIFSLIVNVFLIMLAAYLVPGFEIFGFIPALVGSIVLSLVAAFLNLLTK